MYTTTTTKTNFSSSIIQVRHKPINQKPLGSISLLWQTWFIPHVTCLPFIQQLRSVFKFIYKILIVTWLHALSICLYIITLYIILLLLWLHIPWLRWKMVLCCLLLTLHGFMIPADFIEWKSTSESLECLSQAIFIYMYYTSA